MNQYLLDVLINDADLSPDLANAQTPFGIMLRVDGLASTVNTPMVYQKGQRLSWNHPSRMILDIPDISTAYLYVVLYTTNPHSPNVETKGTAKVRLSAFPVGKPKKFSFPLKQYSNTAITTGSLHLTATISAFVPQYASMPTYRPQPMYGPPVPQKGYYTTQ